MKQYFPNMKNQEFLQEATGRICEFYKYLNDSGIYSLYSTSLKYFFGGRSTGGWFESSKQLTEATATRDISRLKINHYRSLVKNILQLSSSTKPNFSCRASNSDFKSQSQAVLGNSLLDYYMREKNLQDNLFQALEDSVVCLEGWLHVTWQKNAGELYTYDENNKPIWEGDVKVTNHKIDCVIRDTNLKHDQHNWLILREEVNRHDLIAEYPKFQKEIEAECESDSSSDLNKHYRELRPNQYQTNKEHNDFIDVFIFYHKKSPSCPNGKRIVFIKDQVLSNLDLPYEDIPLYCLKPDSIKNTPFGYSISCDLIAPQMMLDVANSTIASNQAQKISNPMWVSDNSDFKVESTGNTKVLRCDTPPQPIDLAPTSPELLNFKNSLQQDMQLLSNISSTVRGQPEASLTSGNALALITSQSIQFHSLLESNFNRILEQVGGSIISHLKGFSKTERVATLIGESNRPFQKSFSSDDISQINRVSVEQTNPLARTISGRLQIAQDLVQQGLIKTPEKYLMVLQTGNLEQLTSGETTELLSVKSENEALRNNQPVTAILTDDHSLHVREHKQVLADPESRMDAELVQRTLSHIEEHIRLARSMDPGLQQILRVEPLQPAPQQGPPGAQQGPNPQEMPGQPNMPVNPLSGERFEPKQ